MERENKELRRANDILKLASAFFAPGGARPPLQVIRAFVDKHRDTHGVEPICRVLQIAPSGYRRHAAQGRNPTLRCARAKRDETLVPDIQRVWETNLKVYGADKVWHQMNREGIRVVGCTVERLMRRLGIQGARLGKTVRTTVSNPATPCPLDRVKRQFKAERPNQLWVADFTYVSTWQGWLYVAFVIDVFARRIVGWQVSSSMHTDFVLDALEQALYARRLEPGRGLIHHSDRGSQYVSIRYSERLGEAEIEPSVGSKGDGYDNALAETINGLYKAELIHRRGPWKTKTSVELATLEWVAWFNQQRLYEYLKPSAQFTIRIPAFAGMTGGLICCDLRLQQVILKTFLAARPKLSLASQLQRPLIQIIAVPTGNFYRQRHGLFQRQFFQQHCQCFVECGLVR